MYRINQRVVPFFIALAVFVDPQDLWGAAMHIGPQGAAASASAWCVTARPLDASTVLYNPAGMGLFKGTHILSGINLFIYDMEYEAGEDSVSSGTGYYFPMHLYVLHTFDRGVSLGFGMYSPYGLGGSFPGDWAGRYIFTEVDQQTIFFNPVVSVDVRKFIPKAPEVYLAAGFRLAYGKTTLKQHLTFSPISVVYGDRTIPWATSLLNTLLAANWNGQDTLVEVDGDGFGTGFNLGLLWRVTKRLSLGLTYQSKIKITNEGRATFVSPGMDEGFSQLFFVDDDISLDFNYPDRLHTGIAYTPIDILTLEFDFWWANWHEYKTLDIDFSNPNNTDISLPQHWDNSYLLGLATEIRPWPVFPIRLGFAYDMTPIPDETVSPTLPDNNRPFIMGGFGYHPERWPLLPIPKQWRVFVDFYYGIGFWDREKDNQVPPAIRKSLVPGTALEDLQVMIDTEQAQANGTYKPTLHMMGISFGVEF
jgi:long-chain fatty acid transport protein